MVLEYEHSLGSYWNLWHFSSWRYKLYIRKIRNSSRGNSIVFLKVRNTFTSPSIAGRLHFNCIVILLSNTNHPRLRLRVVEKLLQDYTTSRLQNTYFSSFVWPSWSFSFLAWGLCNISYWTVESDCLSSGVSYFILVL